MSESRDQRLRRLAMRSARRGTKEMDLILGVFARDRLDAMDEDALALYDRMLSENDQDLYLWVTGQSAPPNHFSELISDISAHVRGA